VALTFTRSATTANRVYVRFTNNAFGTSGSCTVVVSLRKPDGSLLNPPSGTGGQCIAYGGSYEFTETNLPVDGTYTIYVDPQGSNTGSLTVTLYDVPGSQLKT